MVIYGMEDLLVYANNVETWPKPHPTGERSVPKGHYIASLSFDR